MAKESGISALSVARIWRAFGLKPHRMDSFSLSDDPLFVEKVRDVVTATLFAALDVATGRVIGKCFRQHRAKEFVRFLREIDRNVPAELDIHVFLDN